MSSTRVVKELYEAFGQGDLPTVLGLLDEQVHWLEAEGSPYHPGKDGWTGPEAVTTNLFAKMGEDWTEFVVHPMTFHDAGDVVVVEARYTATHAITGRVLDAQACHVWTVTGGRVVKFQQYMDTAQMRHVMGAE